MKLVKPPLAALLFLMLFGPLAAAREPSVCGRLDAHPGWSDAVSAAAERWAVPAPLILAVIRQESNFGLVGLQRPMPGGAFGYAQAVKRTWTRYQDQAGRPNAARTDFADSVDFVGWYLSATRARAGAPYSDTAAHYLAYSRGHGASGPASRTARANAARVARYALAYETELAACPLPVRAQQVALTDFGG